jgi:TolB-like protein
MKKSVLAFVFFIASLSVSAQGFYFDAEVGLGGGWNNYNYDWVDDSGNFPFGKTSDGFAYDIGVKVGFGPFGNVPVYVVTDIEMNGVSLDLDGFIGGGIIFYPIRSLQFGLSLGKGYNLVPKDEQGFYLPSVENSEYTSYRCYGQAGFAWNLSAAILLKKANYVSNDIGFWGLKYSGVVNNFNCSYSYDSYPTKKYTGNGTLLTSSFTVFIKMVTRDNTPKEKAADKARAELEAIAAQEAADRRNYAAMKRAEEEQKRLREKYEGSYPGIKGAVTEAGQELINALPKRSTVAVINIRSRDGGMSDYIATDLEQQLFNAGFTVVDRKELDTILAEQNFQMSGSVDDKSAVSIGKMLAAHIILTGAVIETGAIRRLNIRAIDVETGKIVTMTNQDF